MSKKNVPTLGRVFPMKKVGEYPKECLPDDWTIFGEWVKQLNYERLTPGYTEFFVGLTLERLYLSGIKEVKVKSKEGIRRKVLKNRVLINEMVYWLKLLKSFQNLPPRKVRELTISFWIKSKYCLSHWWLAYRHVSQKWSYYSSRYFLVSQEFKERATKALVLLESYLV